MKKLFKTVCAAVLALCCFALIACGKQPAVVVDGDYVVITVKAENVESGATLKEYMDYLQANDELTYAISDGMVVSINGKKANGNQYWMLYTNDEENSNEAWGTCIYQDVTYHSAAYGAETLVVKDGCVYIWYLQTF